ncbi:MAG: YcxB family protein [Armatimonadetes bacterium]|nr:YcxB family protein [Armatimonadota bacterium]
MKIRYRVELDDIVAFNQFVVDTSKEMRRQRRSWLIAIFAIYVTIGCLQAMFRHSFAPILYWLLFSAVFTAWYYRASRRVNRKRIKRLYSEGKNKGDLCEHELELLPDGICERTSVGEQKATFAGIERIVTNDTHAFIFIGSLLAHVIPRSKIAEGDLDALIAALREAVES